MEKIKEAIDNNLKPAKEVIASAIIEGENDVIYSTESWKITNDIENINQVWGYKNEREVQISAKKYIIIKNSDELLVAIAFGKGKRNKLIPKESIVGFKDDERKILTKLSGDSSLPLAVANAAHTLSDLSERTPYIKSEEMLGKEKEMDLTPKILSETSRILEKLGMSRIGIGEDEAKVYLALLRKGVTGETVGNLDKELDLKRTHIYRIMDRLIEKNWVEELAKFPKSAQLYSARAIIEILNRVIYEKEEEVKVLKGFKLILGESPNGWKIDSLDTKELRKPFDIDIKEIIGFEKDSGIVIFEYDRLIKDEENLDRVKLRLYSEKLKQEIKENGIPDLEEIKIEEQTIKNYLGAEIKIKFKEMSDIASNLGNEWILVAKLVAIPIDNKIYVIWGSEEKFPLLLNVILQLK